MADEITCSKHGWINCILCNNETIVEPIKTIEDKYELLMSVFEEIIVQQFALSELRDVWRKKAGLNGKCIENSRTTKFISKNK